MKMFEHIKEIYSGKAGDIYVGDNGMHIWDVVIDAGIGKIS